jgi:hypothetical protein
MSGLWNEPGVPQRGWVCVDVRDLREQEWGAELVSCQMCGKEDIRFVHVMEHPRWAGGELEVGCVCAEKMSEDPVGPRARERELRKWLERRARFLAKQWQDVGNGQLRRILRGKAVVTAARTEKGWRGRLFRPGQGWTNGRRDFATLHDLKLAMFEFVDPRPRFSLGERGRP